MKQLSKTQFCNEKIIQFLGNYGKAFAYASHKLGLKFCTVAMPNTAPQNRKRLIESYGVVVEMVPSANLSMHVKQVIFVT